MPISKRKAASRKSLQIAIQSNKNHKKARQLEHENEPEIDYFESESCISSKLFNFPEFLSKFDTGVLSNKKSKKRLLAEKNASEKSPQSCLSTKPASTKAVPTKNRKSK